jgi:hypothetical protein
VDFTLPHDDFDPLIVHRRQEALATGDESTTPASATSPAVFDYLQQQQQQNLVLSSTRKRSRGNIYLEELGQHELSRLSSSVSLHQQQQQQNQIYLETDASPFPATAATTTSTTVTSVPSSKRALRSSRSKAASFSSGAGMIGIAATPSSSLCPDEEYYEGTFDVDGDGEGGTSSTSSSSSSSSTSSPRLITQSSSSSWAETAEALTASESVLAISVSPVRKKRGAALAAAAALDTKTWIKDEDKATAGGNEDASSLAQPLSASSTVTAGSDGFTASGSTQESQHAPHQPPAKKGRGRPRLERGPDGQVIRKKSLPSHPPSPPPPQIQNPDEEDEVELRSKRRPKKK